MHKTYEGRGTTKDMTFELLKTDQRLGMYAQYLNPSKNPYNGLEQRVLVGFEVVLLRYQKAASYANVTLEAGWRLPSDKQWGDLAWTFGSREKAEIKFRQLLANNKHRFTIGNKKDLELK